MLRRVTWTPDGPDPDIFETYRDTPPLSTAVLLQKHADFLGGSDINVHHHLQQVP